MNFHCHCCNFVVSPTPYMDDFFHLPLNHCTKCGHIQLKQVPSFSQLKNYYSREYKYRRIKLLDERYFTIMEKRAIAQQIFINKFENIRYQRILDIGCGYGFLAERMRTAGADVSGLEFDPECVHYCNTRLGLKVDLINEENEIIPAENVDLIILSHVLEHLPNIDYFLGKIKSKKKSVFIEVPKYSIHLKEQFINQEGHINFFTESSIRNILEKFGYHILRMVSCGPSMDYFWKSKWRLISFLHRLAYRDYFFDDYQRENPNGIWIRIIALSER